VDPGLKGALQGHRVQQASARNHGRSCGRATVSEIAAGDKVRVTVATICVKAKCLAAAAEQGLSVDAIC
jgi:hypothetical protein